MRKWDDRDYRKVEAMYRRGCDNKYIIKNMPHLCDFETMEIIQKIFALDQIKNEKRMRESY